ncbi:HAMP domain-containing protein [Jeotgalibacillus sp. S-D1]|uniref:cache domain-containing sensor histidine kinase n=1 Tax=Jeotgalibacillus sp. S-D1 TaxID=2552189 RepID=UPI001059BAD0|nr:sensor histidine kinase [Jeotgalibacillus sp. S-D1]TDL31015.1 HAMP domain-containing protein [Jeotgalibacillus sp. S-D1]
MKSIQSRLVIILLIFIIFPYFLSVFLIYGYTKNSVEQHELENSEAQLEKSSEELQQYADDIINLPYILYRNPDLFRIFKNGFEDSIYIDPMATEKSFETFYLMRNEIRQVRFFIDKDQESFTVYNATVSARKTQPDLLEDNALNQLYTSSKTFLIEPPGKIENYNDAAIVPESDNTMVMTFHHKILDVLTNEFLGMITMDIDLDAFARISNNLVQDKEESVLLIDSNDTIMYAKDASLIGTSLQPGLKQKLNDLQTSTGEDIILTKKLSAPLHDWTLVKITPTHILFNEVRKTAYINIIVGLIVGLMGLIMVGIISHKITRPIKELSQKVTSIEGGNMQVPFNDNRQDEIGHLEKHMKDMMDRINLHIEREYKMDIENRKNQFRALKSQVNPHFLFNALQSIGAVALRSNSPRIYDLLTSLSKMMRYSIKANQWVTVREEVNYIKAYLSLQMERFRNNINYSIELSEDILNWQIPSMIVQPLVENFFKHSYEEGFYQAQLRIHGEILEKTLHLTVENEGPSLSPQELRALRDNIFSPGTDDDFSNDHIGLKNIQDRLVLNYGPKAGLTVDSIQGQGFAVTIVIPHSSSAGEQNKD